jgi:pyrroloquinoline quinone biosynthesis protein D
MSLAPEAVPFLPRGVRLHEDRVRGGWALLAPERALALDEIGRAVLSELDGTRSLGEIAGTLADRYGAPEADVLGDCAQYLDALVERRMVEIAR